MIRSKYPSSTIYYKSCYILGIDLRHRPMIEERSNMGAKEFINKIMHAFANQDEAAMSDTLKELYR